MTRPDSFVLFERKMAAAGIDADVVECFRQYYMLLHDEASCHISESAIAPVTQDDCIQWQEIEASAADGEQALRHAVMIKLNGGLGTSMGLARAKSLLPVKKELSFLDIVAHQVRVLNQRYKLRLPLILMDSFYTHDESAAALDRYPELITSTPRSFLQHQFPKILQGTLEPASYPENPELEWYPPGHGDIYTALAVSGLLGRLIDQGYWYAFVSNIDNLGAVLDCRILGYLASNEIPFLMEATARTPMDKKGGHLAKLPGRRLLLRELSQCLPNEIEAFQDIQRYNCFNTNNIWLDLRILHRELSGRKKHLDLPVIRNKKPLDPRNPSSAPVYQLETAMGAAIGLFTGAAALNVPRSRFLPVKKCEDLLVIWSDRYQLDEDYALAANPNCRTPSIKVHLDPKYFGMIDQLIERFRFGAPSLAACESFAVQGDVRFGKNVTAQGAVTIVNRFPQQVLIEDGSILDGPAPTPAPLPPAT